jgi:hypothetical protein
LLKITKAVSSRKMYASVLDTLTGDLATNERRTC